MPSTAIDPVLSEGSRVRTRRRGAGGLMAGLLVLLVVGGAAVAIAQNFFSKGTEKPLGLLTHRVGRGEMLVVVTEDGNVESARNLDIKCQVAGGSTILWIIEDGTQVQEGDVLVRLDQSSLDEQVNQQRIVYEKARASQIQAEEDFAAAKIAVQEYIEGTFVKELQLVDTQITVAMENMRSAQNSLAHTQRMARKGYVTQLQLEADQFTLQRAKLDLETAETSKSVLEKFTRAKMVKQLESTRDAAEARMRAEQASCALEEARLKRLRDQIENCVIKAPQAGMVIFANESNRGGNQVTIEEGAAVREQQTIIRLPDLSNMQVKVLVHESKVERLALGMRARITVQGHELQGTVTSIGSQPDASSQRFSSSTVKQYATIVKIDGNPSALRPGMTATVEILVQHLPSVLTVPVVAVVEQNRQYAAWVLKKTNEIERRPLVLGVSNDKVLEIRDGLAEGEDVLLNPRAHVPEARETGPAAEVDVSTQFGKRAAEGGNGNATPPAGGPRANGQSPTGAAESVPPRSAAAGGPVRTFAQLDLDGDGKISRAEAPEQMQAFFDRIDTNGDGHLDASEYEAMRRRRQQREAAAAADAPAGGGT